MDGKSYRNNGFRYIEKNINIYDDDYYMKNNIWILYDKTKDLKKTKGKKYDIKDYVRLNVNEKNICRFLWDMIDISDYSFYIDERFLNIFTKKEEINKILYKRELHKKSSVEGKVEDDKKGEMEKMEEKILELYNMDYKSEDAEFRLKAEEINKEKWLY